MDENPYESPETVNEQPKKEIEPPESLGWFMAFVVIGLGGIGFGALFLIPGLSAGPSHPMAVTGGILLLSGLILLALGLILIYSERSKDS